ncbi:MAG TPA: DNA-formamidopyrimidine glycosylase family protein [Candidatus Limnocylindria bacterium]|nr:DNA-formamidopyrimidine glycosylase family protein [Candidatus Limnocylindria bacterium]
MPEGDTLARTARVLGNVLVGQQVVAARGRPGGAQLEWVVGRTVESVEARGKHLLIGFSGGLSLHTHLGLHGSWHRYRSGERWRRPASRAVAVLDVASAVCVCFDAPRVELIETRALALHPALAGLGPDVARPDFEPRAALARLRSEGRQDEAVGEALLDQRAVAGLGNVWRNELCFIERLSPFSPLADVPDEVLLRLLERAARLVAASTQSGRRVTTGSRAAPLFVYGRAGRPCRRCGTLVESRVAGERLRRVYWCPRCQPRAPGAQP